MDLPPLAPHPRRAHPSHPHVGPEPRTHPPRKREPVRSAAGPHYFAGVVSVGVVHRVCAGEEVWERGEAVADAVVPRGRAVDFGVFEGGSAEGLEVGGREWALSEQSGEYVYRSMLLLLVHERLS